jgi:hypothetical protein
MPETSYSEVKLYRKCPKAHDYRYYQRLQRKRKPLGLMRGSILHDMLDAQYKVSKGQKNTLTPDGILEQYAEEHKDYFAEELEEYGDIIGDCRTIFNNYQTHYENDPLTYEESEAFVATDLAADLRLIGYLDKVAVDQNGRRWIVDHKFMKSIPSENELMVEIQLLIYVWAWNRWNPDKPIDGVCWDFIRAKTPTVPAVLKSGELSMAKNIDTTYETYLQAIHDNDLDEEDYEGILERLKDKADTFHKRHYFPLPNKTMMDTIIKDFRDTAVTIQYMKGVCPRAPNKFNCMTCDFKELCEAEIRGHDVAFITKKYYESRDQEKKDGKRKKSHKKVQAEDGGKDVRKKVRKKIRRNSGED